MAEMKAPFIEWGVSARALPGQADSGDRSLVRPEPEGALVAVVDGLGHGLEAASTAERAIRAVDRLAGEPLLAILAGCHEALLGTRGATLSLARWNARARDLNWLGVGDVTGLFLGAASGPGGGPREHLVRRVGVVGVMLTPPLPQTVSVTRGGLLVLATDGIAGGFDRTLDPTGRPGSLADQILDGYSRENDDALVLVARLIAEER
jgi:hypothetical protein